MFIDGSVWFVLTFFSLPQRKTQHGVLEGDIFAEQELEGDWIKEIGNFIY